MSTIIVGLVVVAIVVFAIRRLKKSKNGCHSGCSGCGKNHTCDHK